MKFLTFIKNRFTFGLVVNLIFVLVILLQIYLVHSSLYLNLDPQPAGVLPAKIVKVDLKSYGATTELLAKIKNFSQQPLVLVNQNPFTFIK